MGSKTLFQQFHNMTARLYGSLFLTLLLSLCSCSLFQDFHKRDQAEEGNSPSLSTTDSSDGSPSESQQRRTGIEVTWQVPSEPVDGFIVRYGASQDAMTSEKKVSVSELSQEDDLEFGPVYRFIIPDISDSSPIFVSVAAFKGDRLSDFSDVIQEGRQ